MTRYYIHPANWNNLVLPNLKASGRRLGDGFYAIGAPGHAAEALGPTQAMVATMRAMGYEVIPGLQLFSGNTIKNSAAWYQYAYWQRAALWVKAFPGSDFALDAEPGWNNEPRYVGVEKIALLSVVMQPFIAACQATGVHLHLLPGPGYGFVAALAWALGGDHITICDEATYNWDDDSPRVARQVRDGLAALGTFYTPGVKLARLRAFQAAGFGDCWVYADGAEMVELGK